MAVVASSTSCLLLFMVVLLGCGFSILGAVGGGAIFGRGGFSGEEEVESFANAGTFGFGLGWVGNGAIFGRGGFRGRLKVEG